MVDNAEIAIEYMQTETGRGCEERERDGKNEAIAETYKSIFQGIYTEYLILAL